MYAIRSYYADGDREAPHPAHGDDQQHHAEHPEGEVRHEVSGGERQGPIGLPRRPVHPLQVVEDVGAETDAAGRERLVAEQDVELQEVAVPVHHRQIEAGVIDAELGCHRA